MKIENIKPNIKTDVKPNIKKDMKPNIKTEDVKPIIKKEIKPLKQEEIDELNKVYFNADSGFNSIDKLYRKIKDEKENIKITKAQVKQYLENQLVYQITKPVKSNKVFDTIVSPSLRNNYQMDIMYLPNSKSNKGYKYLLTCIDVYSRYVFCLPVKKKEGSVVFRVIKKLFEENGIPKNLNIDEGAEFLYTPFRKYCDEHDITLYVSNPEQENKNSIIERFHRTLRALILKYEIVNNTSYIQDLQKLIQNYNTAYHSTLQATPEEVWKGDKNIIKKEILKR